MIICLFSIRSLIIMQSKEILKEITKLVIEENQPSNPRLTAKQNQLFKLLSTNEKTLVRLM